MAKSDELIKYITERVVTYIDTPREQRKRYREDVKIKRGRWDVRWFGMLPLAVSMWVNGLRRTVRRYLVRRK
jgi:hypothetical protein